MELSDRIRRAIELCPRKQYEIAEHCQVTSGAITQWKNGLTGSLKLDNLYRLSDITGFSARWLAIGEGPERNSELPGAQLTSHETALLSIYNDLTKEQQEMLFGIIQGMKSVKSVSPHPKKKGNKEVRETGS
jgi:transcriptional regulator with XRE-family HTH domain